MPSDPIIRAAGAEDMPLVARLFRAYQRWLDISLDFQNFEQELADLPGAYGAPVGGLWLAWRGETAVGIVALRRLEPGVGEMKRLWVPPEARGLGIGRLLAERCLEGARERGYGWLRLDSLPRLDRAIALYLKMGFEPCAPFNDSPVPGTVYLEKNLRADVTERS